MLAFAAVGVACSAAPTTVPEAFASEALALEQRTLADVVAHFPEAEAALDRAVGYAIFSSRARKVPVVGRGEGLGVAVDRESGERRYLRVTHFDVGGGLGDLTYRFVIVYFDRGQFERLRTGTVQVGANVDAATGSDPEGDGRSAWGKTANASRAVYVLSDRGAAAIWTIRLLRVTPLEES